MIRRKKEKQIKIKRKIIKNRKQSKTSKEDVHEMRIKCIRNAHYGI